MCVGLHHAELASRVGGHALGAESGVADHAEGDLVGRGQLGLTWRLQHRLVLQLGQREVVGNLAEDLRKRCPQGAADGGQQLRGGLFLPPLNLGQVTQ